MLGAARIRLESDNAWGETARANSNVDVHESKSSVYDLGRSYLFVGYCIIWNQSLVRVEPEPEPIPPEMESRRRCGFRLESGESIAKD